MSCSAPFSFPLAGKVTTPASSRGIRMGAGRFQTPTPALWADPPRKGEGCLCES
jgi:hypothetical protein